MFSCEFCEIFKNTFFLQNISDDCPWGDQTEAVQIRIISSFRKNLRTVACDERMIWKFQNNHFSNYLFWEGTTEVLTIILAKFMGRVID